MSSKIFETHAHYDDEQFEEDRDELLASLVDRGIETVINIGASIKGCRASIELANKYEHVYAAVGIHPDEVGSLNEETYSWLKKQFHNEKIVAVGEIGLDYYWDNESHEVQKKWFVEQLKLAKEIKLPVVIHSREATEDTLTIMKEYGRELRGVIHCFSGSVEVAREYVKMGYYLGIGGVVTFKNAKKLKEVVADTPIENLVLETDCPYLAPTPHRGKRNDSTYLEYVAKEIAEIKGITYEEVVSITRKNGKDLYGI
ncbi:MAG: TatD family hydrolase [Eubacteriales bacterium]